MARIVSFETREDALAALKQMDEEQAEMLGYFLIDDPEDDKAIPKIIAILEGVSPRRRIMILLKLVASTIAAASKNSMADLARFMSGAKWLLEVMALAAFRMAANSQEKDPDDEAGV